MRELPSQRASSLKTAIDQAVGEAIRQRRLGLRLTAADLAEAIGAPLGRIEAYEAGRERVEAEHLRLIAITLKTPIAAFFGAPIRRQ